MLVYLTYTKAAGLYSAQPLVQFVVPSKAPLYATVVKPVNPVKLAPLNKEEVAAGRKLGAVELYKFAAV